MLIGIEDEYLLNATDNIRMTPLMWAVKRCYVDMVKDLC